MLKTLRAFVTDESGVTAIEYGLIASLIAVAAIGAFSAVGSKLTASMTGISKQIK